MRSPLSKHGLVIHWLIMLVNAVSLHRGLRNSLISSCLRAGLMESILARQQGHTTASLYMVRRPGSKSCLAQCLPAVSLRLTLVPVSGAALCSLSTPEAGG